MRSVSSSYVGFGRSLQPMSNPSNSHGLQSAKKPSICPKSSSGCSSARQCPHSRARPCACPLAWRRQTSSIFHILPTAPLLPKEPTLEPRFSDLPSHRPHPFRGRCPPRLGNLHNSHESLRAGRNIVGIRPERVARQSVAVGSCRQKS